MPAAPLNPPRDWFSPPGEIPTDKRITITADGRVYGYVALWNSCHVGMPGCQAPPKGSPTNYELAHQGQTELADGTLLATANVGGGSGHASPDPNMSPESVAKFYENTSTQLMRVRYGEDDKGLWFAGALWPDINDMDRARILASSVSGDWRWLAGWRNTASGYDFSGACFVNVPGYPMQAAGDITSRPGKMLNIAASAITGDIYALDEIVPEKTLCNCNVTVTPPVQADCGCGGTYTSGGEEVSGPVVVASPETLVEPLNALNMKIDEVLARVARIEDDSAKLEAAQLLQDLSQ